MKKLRKQLISTESNEEVQRLAAQMHIVEVDLNYTQYHPLNETYISLYPPTDSKDEVVGEERPKPPMWSEVERAMEEGTLDRLRNRRLNAPVRAGQSMEKKVAKKVVNPKSKPKQEPASIDTTGLNRRQRRKALGIQDSRGKTKAIPGKKIDSAAGGSDAGQADESDGGFFEL